MRERMIVCGVIWGLQALTVAAWEGGKWAGRKLASHIQEKRKRR